MKLGVYGRQLLSQDGATGQVENHPSDESRKVALDPATNWALKSLRSHYDWMDSHSPFDCFD